MSFLQEQTALHIQASTELAVIKVYRQMLNEVSKESPMREYYHRLVMESQVNYADIMRKLTEKYIPFQEQLPNVIAVHTFEMAEDAG